jgi:hypothetical protein
MSKEQAQQAEEEVPLFEITQAPGFATGLVMHQPGEVIPWAVPEDWSEKRYGKHYAEYGPSITFLPRNKAAEDLMTKHKAKLAANAAAATRTPDSARFEKMEKMHLEVMSALMEQQAENRRLRAQMDEVAAKKK